VDEQGILEKARQQGLESIEQIKYAMLDHDGGISIIPTWGLNPGRYEQSFSCHVGSQIFVHHPSARSGTFFGDRLVRVSKTMRR
jgi:uncharacterized membrane protein YcaP (DUF421 family)